MFEGFSTLPKGYLAKHIFGAKCWKSCTKIDNKIDSLPKNWDKIGFFNLTFFFRCRCGVPMVLHEPTECQDHKEEYVKYRRPKGRKFADQNHQIDMRWYFRNYFKCSHDFNG